MWAYDIDSPEYAERLAAIEARATLPARDAGRAADRGARHRDLLRRDGGGGGRAGGRRSAPRSSRARSTCTPATAGWCPSWPAGPTSTLLTPVVAEALGRAGLAAVPPGSTRWPPPAARAWWAPCWSASRATPRRWPWPGTCPSSGSTTWRPTCSPPCSSTPTSTGRWSCCWSRAATPCWSRWPGPAATGCSARPSTTPPARPSTRWPATSASATRAGPAIDRIAGEGDPAAFAFPRALLDEGYDFSFSGLKTAVVRTVERHPEAADRRRGRLVPGGGRRRAGGQGRAGRWPTTGARGLCLAGGVAANSLLRRRVAEACAADGVPAYLPSLAMCTDNAAMVAAAGAWRLAHDGPSPCRWAPSRTSP